MLLSKGKHGDITIRRLNSWWAGKKAEVAHNPESGVALFL